MGLDIYVGSLSRYYAREWETISQTYAREQGMAHQTLYTSQQEKIDQDQIRAEIIGWRDAVRNSVTEEPIQLDWDESPEAPYFTDKPDWDGYGALLLWAAYSEHPDLIAPENMSEKWSEDEAFYKSTSMEFRTQYPALMRSDIWVPEELPFSVGTIDLMGNDIVIGSVPKLGSELLELNDKTWKADAETITSWLKDCPEVGGNLEKAAQFGFAMFLNLANKSIESNLVMKLDF